MKPASAYRQICTSDPARCHCLRRSSSMDDGVSAMDGDFGPIPRRWALVVGRTTALVAVSIAGLASACGGEGGEGGEGGGGSVEWSERGESTSAVRQVQ